MTTLSPTKARSNLTQWLQRAAQGEDIGILYGDRVIALRPVEVEATDYALRQYGATEAEMESFTKKLHAEGEKNRKTGQLKTYSGNLEALL
jgi:antitoxin (DNA-binding transcriptional repressor) of toxin-antitoxin stability system